LVEVGSGQDDSLNRSIPPAQIVRGMKFRVGFNLESQVRRRVQKKPVTLFVPDCCLKLKPRWNNPGFQPAKSTKFAGAVPLGDAATGGRPQQPEIQHPLDFRGGVAVNFTSEAYFFEFRAGPDLVFHGSLPVCCEMQQVKAIR
jgi:hypothetical protein